MRILKAFIINIFNNPQSKLGAERCFRSIEKTGSHLEPFIYPATVPEYLSYHWDLYLGDVQWNYPDEGYIKQDLLTGLSLTGYPTKDIKKRKSCLLSHVRLWHLCVQLKEPIMVLEHDAAFTRQFVFRKIQDEFTGGILGLNSPLKATRLAGKFHEQVVGQHIPSNKFTVMDAPWIDREEIPQGLAGNSAYIIKPFAAKALLNRMKDIGAWPNDALMCKQQFPWLQVIYPYFTEVQGIKSTTSL